MVVVAGGVCPYRVEHGRADFALNLAQELLIRFPLLLLGIVESVHTYVLQGTCALRCGKGIGGSGLIGHLAPLSCGVCLRSVDRHSALIELLAVTQDVLAHLAKVDVEVASIFRSLALATCIDEGVEHPELYVLHVGSLEVVGVELAHHAAPMLLRIVERSVLSEVGIEVVRSALVGIVGKIEYGERRRSSVVRTLVAVGEQFVDIELANVMVAELFEVALDVAWRERRRAAREQGVDGVPRKSRAVEARAQSGHVRLFGEHRRN